MRYQTFFEHDGKNLSFKAQYKIIEKDTYYILYIRDIKERSKKFKELKDAEIYLRNIHNNLYNLAKYEESMR